MQDFIKQAASKFGMSEDSTQDAAGGLLNFVKDSADKNDFSQLLEKVPGASELVNREAPSGGGGIGGMLGSVTSAFGSSGGGGAAGIIGTLAKSGLGADKVGGFASMFVGYLKQKAGGALMGNILGKVPDLTKLIG